MTYRYNGKDVIERHGYVPLGEGETRAKFAYFRESESKINGGPVPSAEHSGCGTDRGYMRHLRRKEARCQPCKTAHAAAESKRYHKRKRIKLNSQTRNNNRRRKIPEITAPQNRISGDQIKRSR